MRSFTPEMVDKIKIIVLFRQFSIPLKNIKELLDNFSFEKINKLVHDKKQVVIKELREATMNWLNLQDLIKLIDEAKVNLTEAVLGEIYNIYVAKKKDFAPWNKRQEMIKDIFLYAKCRLTYEEVKDCLIPEFSESILKETVKALEFDDESFSYNFDLCTYGVNSRIFVSTISKNWEMSVVFVINLDNKITGIWIENKKARNYS